MSRKNHYLAARLDSPGIGIGRRLALVVSCVSLLSGCGDADELELRGVSRVNASQPIAEQPEDLFPFPLYLPLAANSTMAANVKDDVITFRLDLPGGDQISLLGTRGESGIALAADSSLPDDLKEVSDQYIEQFGEVPTIGVAESEVNALTSGGTARRQAFKQSGIEFYTRLENSLPGVVNRSIGIDMDGETVAEWSSNPALQSNHPASAGRIGLKSSDLIVTLASTSGDSVRVSEGGCGRKGLPSSTTFVDLSPDSEAMAVVVEVESDPDADLYLLIGQSGSEDSVYGGTCVPALAESRIRWEDLEK